MSDRKRAQRITRVTSWPLHPPPPHPVEAEAEAEAAWQRSPCLDATWGSIDLSALGWYKAWWGTSPWPTAARSLIASTQPAGPFPGQSQDNLVEGAAPWPDGGGHTMQPGRRPRLRSLSTLTRASGLDPSANGNYRYGCLCDMPCRKYDCSSHTVDHTEDWRPL